MVDKNLFLHDLAIVAILKCEAPYLKEWLDYHLFAGVDHFYLYDNESPDNQAEVAKPYVEAGLVDYFPAPGKMMQYLVYNDAVKRFKFQSRYMSFLDGDEFIFPRTGGGVVEVVDEVFSQDPTAAGLAINWHMFGSNGQKTADYSRGVLERFTRRSPDDHENILCKNVSNPRMIDYVFNGHFSIYFDGYHAVNEHGEFTKVRGNNSPVTGEKIIINHYHTKSREEYDKKLKRGGADHNVQYTDSFDEHDRNEVFDDEILKYRDARSKNFRPPDKSRAAERLLNALTVNLSPTLLPNTPQDFYRGKLETFLTCRAVAEYLQTRLTDAAVAKFFEEAALGAIFKSINGMTFADAAFFLRELPNLLKLPYPVVNDLHNAALQVIPQMMNTMHQNALWKKYVDLDYLMDILKLKG